ncbi:MAG TPA: DUF2169 domain-containing protein [Sandaracinaceae bacterium LLY-WYZ-13_1]|nr:DUF2169 domain-containing protein [Sandaracinaceae bacterium LLY-WYZ-13_1]
MRGVKPFKLSFISRPFSWGQSHHLGVGVLAYFPLQKEPALLTDQQMWMEVPEVLGQEFALDFGIPKSRSEFLLAGSAYQPGGRPGPVRHVRARVGSIEKSLYVVGDRHWQDNGVPSEPVPFVRMPLTWDRAFGGEGFDRNPAGKGFAKVEVEGTEVRPLPNVEVPGAMIRSPRDRPDPASFRAIDFASPDRMSLAGTYDKKWLDTRFPGFAEDMDWRIWNMAPPDQHQDEPFRGDEEIVLEHLHPEKPELEARLPGIRARCFVLQRVGEDEDAREEFHEVALKLTTVWLLPDIERGLLVFHGAHPVREDDADDIDTVMVAGERCDAPPRSIAHYQDVLARRLGDDGPLEALNEADLMPEGFQGLGEDMDRHLELATIEQLRLKRQHEASAKRMQEARDKVEALGLDPDEHGPQLPDDPPDVPKLSEISSIVEKLQAEAEKQKADFEHRKQEQMEALAKLCEATGTSLEEMKEELSTPMTGPPNYSAEGERAKFRKLAEEYRERHGEPEPELEQFATDEAIYQRWLDAEQQMNTAYWMMAHTQHPAPPAPEPSSDERRRAVVEALQRGETLADWDLTGVNLSALDLSGTDLSRSFLESANLSAATLDGARLEKTVLAHADLRGASLVDANLAEANLGKTDLTGAQLTRAVLRGAILTDVNLSAADLEGADLTEASFSTATLDGARFRAAQLALTTFYQTPLHDVGFAGADLTHATFMEVQASEIDFSGGCLEDATFFRCEVDRAVFTDCHMPRFRVLESTMRGARFERATMTAATMRATDLTGAVFGGAKLDRADFSNANLEEANLYRIVARESMWVRTKLRRAQMISADLFEAILEKADLRGTDLRGANLYGANLALMRSDADTTVEEAIKDRVRVLPLREQP